MNTAIPLTLAALACMAGIDRSRSRWIEPDSHRDARAWIDRELEAQRVKREARRERKATERIRRRSR